MKLEAKSAFVVDGGENLDTMEMSIDVSDQAVLMSMLSEGIYKDPVGSIIREWTSNALDSHTEAGVTEPVIVSLKQDGQQAWVFSVQDFGMGISPERMEKVIRKYAASTKRHDNSMLGAFGLGLKSGLSYVDSFTFTTRWEGMETQYMMYKGEKKSEISKLWESPTEERNGTTFSLQLKHYNDRSEFIQKCKQQLCYFESVYFDVPRVNNNFEIVKSKDWKYSSLNNDRMLHLSLDNVYYPLDYNKLGISSIAVSLALNFNMGEGLIPIFSREDIKYTPQAKDLILNKIRAVATEIIEKRNLKTIEVETFEEVIPLLSNTNYEIAPNITIDYNVLLKYTDVKPTAPTVRGIKFLNLAALAAHTGDIFSNYCIKGQINGGVFTGYDDGHREIENPIILDSRQKMGYSTRKYIEIKEKPRGLQLTYIKQTQGNCYVIKKRYDIPLKPKQYDFSVCYTNLLGLNKFNKEHWRTIIQEYQALEKKWIEKWLIPYEKIVPTKEWLEERKANRKVGLKTLVAKTEVHPKYATRALKGWKAVVFNNEKVVDVAQTAKEKFLNVYGTLEDRPRLENVFNMDKQNILNVCILSPRDFKKVVNAKNWINITDFMKGETRPFQRYCTAVRINKAFKEHGDIINSVAVINLLSTSFGEMIKTLQDYTKKYSSYMNAEFEKEMLDFCEENNLFDPEIIDILKEFEEIASTKFNFLKYFTQKVVGISPESLQAMVDILKYRKFKLNLSWYTKKEEPMAVNEDGEIELEEIDVED